MCVGADAKLSSNSHSHILDVFACAHARIKDPGKPNRGSRDLKEVPSTGSHPPNQFMQTAQMLSSSTSVGNSSAHKEKGALSKKLKQKGVKKGN